MSPMNCRPAHRSSASITMIDAFELPTDNKLDTLYSTTSPRSENQTGAPSTENSPLRFGNSNSANSGDAAMKETAEEDVSIEKKDYYPLVLPWNLSARTNPPLDIELQQSPLISGNLFLNSSASTANNLHKSGQYLSTSPIANGPPLPLQLHRGGTRKEMHLACEALEQHMKARWPNVKAATLAFQKGLGIRNGDVFEVPKVPARPHTPAGIWTLNPGLKHLRGPAFAPRAEEPSVADGFGNHLPKQTQQQVQGLEHGLREILLMHGRQPYGKQHKTELRSLSFHNVTLNMRTALANNELLAHYEADNSLGSVGFGTRLCMYEVDIPIPTNPGGSPAAAYRSLPTERWIWFLISVPLITFESPFYKGPLDFPNPVPTSWLAFAAPLVNVTKESPIKDTIFAKPSYLPRRQAPKPPVASKKSEGVDTDSEPSLGPTSQPGSHRHIQVKGQTQLETQTKVVQRLDFTFSSGGVPRFEFVEKRSFIGTLMDSPLSGQVEAASSQTNTREKLWTEEDVFATAQDDDFLCGVGLPNYDLNNDRYFDPSLPLPHSMWGNTNWAQGEVRPANNFSGQKDGLWWQAARESFRRDALRWKAVKEAMARGACRVVARIEEAEEKTGTRSNGLGLKLKDK